MSIKRQISQIVCPPFPLGLFRERRPAWTGGPLSELLLPPHERKILRPRNTPFLWRKRLRPICSGIFRQKNCDGTEPAAGGSVTESPSGLRGRMKESGAHHKNVPPVTRQLHGPQGTGDRERRKPFPVRMRNQKRRPRRSAFCISLEEET